MTLVVDASVAIKWFLPEPGAELARTLILDDAATVAPELVLAEVGNVLWRRHREGYLSVDDVGAIAADLPQLYARLYPLRSLTPRAQELSLRIDHPIYECYYLALAEHLDAKLITADARFAKRVGETAFASRIEVLA